MKEEKEITPVLIENRIFTFRGEQVMIDTDLAEMYQVETKVLNQAVKRNIERFPESFRFQLSENEVDSLRSQIATSSNLKSQTVTTSASRSQIVTLENGRGKHRKYLPYAFTEQGVAMLSAVLRSQTAVKVRIAIMNAFVQMRKTIGSHRQLLQLSEDFTRHKLEANDKFEKIFKALEAPEVQNKQGVFFDGQTYDAYAFVNRLINAQYPSITATAFAKAHDRFLIIDQNEVYHLGASLKDLGKKWFAFSKLETGSVTVLQSIKELI